MISVIIPNFNRANALPKTLESLLNQTDNSAITEYIVVDDGSTDESVTIIGEFQEKSQIQLKLIRHANKGPAAARNAGVKASTGEVLLFWDSDMIAEKRLIYHHSRIQSEETRSVAAGALRFWPPAMATSFSRNMNSGRLDEDQYGRGTPSFQEVLSSNFSIQKALFWEIGGFDESLRAYEDIDFSYRAMKAGIELIFCRDAIGYHNQTMTLEEASRQQERYQKYAAAFLQKHPELVGEIRTLVDKEPIHWSSDRPGLVLRKLFHQLLAIGPVVSSTTRLAKVLESYQVSDRFMRRLYWLVLDAYQLRGYREGLKLHPH
jgi:glycosyltransferase involved in cell wall biosynthesis